MIITHRDLIWGLILTFLCGVLFGATAFWAGYKFGCKAALEYFRQRQRETGSE